MRSTLVKAAVVVASAFAATSLIAGTALADPPASHTVAATDIDGTGSDTIQYALDDVAASWDATSPAPTNYVASWDAVNPTTQAVGDNITVKPGDTIARPDGSSAGITALENDSFLDFARSSRGPQSSDVDPTTGNPLLFLPFAQDQLNYAVASTTNAPLNLTTAQLVSIYECTDTTWTQVGGTSSDTIIPEIPQSGSGTRSFFEQTLGITDANLGSCVHTIQENTPSDISGSADNIAPFSYAQFTSRYSNSGIKLNTSNFVAYRLVYNVVRLDATTGTVAAKLQPFFGDGSGTAGSNGYICSAAGQKIVNADGFTSLPTSNFPNTTCGEATYFGE